MEVKYRMRSPYLRPFLIRERYILPSYHFPIRGRLIHSSARTVALPILSGMHGLHGTHTSSKNFPDPESCWAPGATGKPNWSKIILALEATLEVPATCSGSIIARTILRDVVTVGGAADFVDSIRFGVSDGTNFGGLEKATRVVQSVGNTPGLVEFDKTIPWNGKACTARNDLFVYVRHLVGGNVLTFMEIGFYPRVEDNKGAPVDRSLKPAIRLDPCAKLVPIRSPYVRGKEDQQYRRLKLSERRKVVQKTNQMFREETGVTRLLDTRKSADRQLANQWLRIRDSVMSANGK